MNYFYDVASLHEENKMIKYLKKAGFARRIKFSKAIGFLRF